MSTVCSISLDKWIEKAWWVLELWYAWHTSNLLFSFLLFLNAVFNTYDIIVFIFQVAIDFSNAVCRDFIQRKIELIFWEEVLLTLKKLHKRRADTFQNVKLLKRWYWFVFWVRKLFPSDCSLNVLFDDFLRFHGCFKFLRLIIIVLFNFSFNLT